MDDQADAYGLRRRRRLVLIFMHKKSLCKANEILTDFNLDGHRQPTWPFLLRMAVPHGRKNT
ncbi:uncharacterized protein Dvar_18020 [Desulfosarcina variabilis str. Montpellier]